MNDLLPSSEKLLVHPRIDLLKLLAERPRDPYQLNKELGITYRALYTSKNARKARSYCRRDEIPSYRTRGICVIKDS